MIILNCLCSAFLTYEDSHVIMKKDDVSTEISSSGWEAVD